MGNYVNSVPMSHVRSVKVGPRRPMARMFSPPPPPPQQSPPPSPPTQESSVEADSAPEMAKYSSSNVLAFGSRVGSVRAKPDDGVEGDLDVKNDDHGDVLEEDSGDGRCTNVLEIAKKFGNTKGNGIKKVDEASRVVVDLSGNSLVSRLSGLLGDCFPFMVFLATPIFILLMAILMGLVMRKPGQDQGEKTEMEQNFVEQTFLPEE